MEYASTESHTLALVNLLCECSFSINCTYPSVLYTRVFFLHMYFLASRQRCMRIKLTHRTTNHLCDGCTVSLDCNQMKLVSSHLDQPARTTTLLYRFLNYYHR
jgi:hypothetical protein